MKKNAFIVLGVFIGALLSWGPGTPATGASGAVKAPWPSGESVWTPIGPDGGQVRALTQNAKNPAEIYAAFGSNPVQIFRSTTGARSWTRSATINTCVADLATDPRDANVVYLYAGWRVYRSSDRAATFPDEIALPSDFNGYSGRMAVHPTNPKILFVTGSFITNRSTWASCPAVARTTDGGKTWTVIKFEQTSKDGEITAIGIHPKSPNVIVIGGTYTKDNKRKAGIYRSTNGGGSFKDVTKDSVFNVYNYPQVFAVTFHPTDPNTTLVGHSAGVARTATGGSAWENQNAQGRLSASALTTDKGKPGTYYALGASNAEDYRGCWKSTDGGQSWTNYPAGIYGYGTRLLANGNAIIAGTWAGVFRSLNAGINWKTSHSKIRATRTDSFAVAPSSPTTIYVELSSYGLFKTVNGGGAWPMCPYFYRCESILGFIVHPSDPKKLFFLAGG